MITIAALYVDPKGTYSGLEGVDCWGEDRDARTYAGPWPVVAHPPCARWCQLAHAVEGRYGYKVGDDGGCFEAALAAVRRFGGVLEHPAFSIAWARFGLPRPPGVGVGWIKGLCGGWACQVDQSQYGHKARKTTWLYLFGAEPPSMRWGAAPDGSVTHQCGYQDQRGKARNKPTLGKREASATPPAFRDVLVAMARSVPRILLYPSVQSTAEAQRRQLACAHDWEPYRALLWGYLEVDYRCQVCGGYRCDRTPRMVKDMCVYPVKPGDPPALVNITIADPGEQEIKL